MWLQPKDPWTDLSKIKKHPLKNYVFEETAQAYKKVEKLETEGSTLQRDDIQQMSKFFFELGKSSYTGIESNLPSIYYELYPSYLKDNEYYLKKLRPIDKKATKRILIARSGGEIRTDAMINPQSYKNFIEWHRRNDMGLYWIERDLAESIRRESSLDTTDVGFWDGSFAVTFTPTNHQSIRIKMIKKRRPLYPKVKNYVNKVIDSAQLLTLSIDQLPIFSKEVLQRWEGYIGSYQFRKKGIGKVLAAEFNPSTGWKPGRILDAAAGSGYETLILAEQGYDVTANEVDPVWNAILSKKLSAKKVPAEVYQHDWRELSAGLKPLYSGIVSVGNSLCMLIGKDQRKKSIQQFYKILKPGGKLIIDERNFELIMKTLKAGYKYYSKGAIYACDKMDGLLNIEDGPQRLIRISFFDVKSGKVLGYTVIQAPYKNELSNAMRSAGFKDIKTYSDLKPGLDEKAGLFTYVGTK